MDTIYNWINNQMTVIISIKDICLITTTIDNVIEYSDSINISCDNMELWLPKNIHETSDQIIAGEITISTLTYEL